MTKTQDRSLILLLVLLIGLLVVAPYINFQNYLSQGDHGRDLYAAQAVYRGALPYKDFWWVYGPLTPYYYGLFFKLLGTKITSMIAGKLVLKILGGMLMFLALSELCLLPVALIGSCWFLLFQQDFFFTYNHIAGLVMCIGTAWCLLAYIQQSNPKDLFKSLAFIFVLCLIKVNFGLAALGVWVLTAFAADIVSPPVKVPARKHLYLAALFVLPAVVFLIYWFFLHGLTVTEIRQCLPYKEGDQPYTTSLGHAISHFLKVTWGTMSSNWMNVAMALVINASALRCLYLAAKGRLPGAKRLLLSLGMLALFYAANSHEYLISGVWYRIFWAQPLGLMLIFVLIDTACRSFSVIPRKIIYSLLIAIWVTCWIFTSIHAWASKTPGQFFDTPHGGIYVTNPPEWINAVEETTAFLNKTLKSNELFFALPYDCLYYYLTGKKAPTRQLIFFEHIKITPQQERSVISELERNHVNYVLVSNRAFARRELGLGFLGKNYCPLIAKYINDHFVPLARFGDWHHEPGWAWNHGTLILKRKGIK